MVKKYKKGDLVDYTNGRSSPIKLTSYGARLLNDAKKKKNIPFSNMFDF